METLWILGKAMWGSWPRGVKSHCSLSLKIHFLWGHTKPPSCWVHLKMQRSFLNSELSMTLLSAFILKTQSSHMIIPGHKNRHDLFDKKRLSWGLDLLTSPSQSYRSQPPPHPTARQSLSDDETRLLIAVQTVIFVIHCNNFSMMRK